MMEKKVKDCILELDEEAIYNLQSFGGVFFVTGCNEAQRVSMQICHPIDRNSHKNISHLPFFYYEADPGVGWDHVNEEAILTPIDQYRQDLMADSERIAIQLTAAQDTLALV